MSWINFLFMEFINHGKGFQMQTCSWIRFQARAARGIEGYERVAEEEAQKMPARAGHRYGRELAYLAGICSST